MENYYKECLDRIKSLSANGQLEEAKRMLEVELSMPYVPQPYLSEFQALRYELDGQDALKPAYFLDIESIHRAFYGDQSLQAKALLSLERMNLRTVREELTTLLTSDIADSLKRYVLLICLEQELSINMTLQLDGETITVDLDTLENPFQSEGYLQIIQELRDQLESKNPSLLELCYEELNQQMMMHFPKPMENISATSIYQRVTSYFE